MIDSQKARRWAIFKKRNHVRSSTRILALTLTVGGANMYEGPHE